jgi:phenylpyruvate tautomerase PptA (4-oxalocrotonate tautomerase family)
MPMTDIVITEGSISPQKLEELVLDAEGADHSFDNLSRVWVHIREISEGYWGAFGDIAEMNDIATFVMGEPAIGHKTDRATRWRTEFDSIGAQD